MTNDKKRPEELEKIEDLKVRLQEAEETLEAIRSGAIDAIVIEGENQQQIFTLKSADYTYRLLIESMNQGALTISRDGTILYSNKQFSEMIGVPLEKVIGSQIQSYITDHDKPRLQRLINDEKKNDQEVTVEIDHSPYLAVMISATKLPADDISAYMYVVVTDMTERVKAENAKDEFISLASHQLRTPATGVKQYLGMILEGYADEISEKNRIFIQTAYDTNERQLNIVNDILKTAQIDSDTFEMKKTKRDVSILVKKILKDYSPIFRIKKQNIITELDPAVASVDANEIQLAVSNIIENATKYSGENTDIKIKVFKQDSNALITVTDQGIGILEADKKRIFDKFTRLDNAMKDNVSGSGLGLYWVKRIVRMHNGTITISSEPDKGTTFTISIPDEKRT